MLEKIHRFLLGIPVLTIILSTGTYLTVETGFIQFRLFRQMCKEFFISIKTKDNTTGNISGYRALCTALASTVGTGNIVGVAGAITLGGPGIVFWLWVCGFLGMVIKIAEVSLAVKYRQRAPSGEWMGGPMYVIKNALPARYHCLAFLYAILGVIASFGIGNTTQVNAIVSGLSMLANNRHHALGWPQLFIAGLVIVFFVAAAQCRGASGIGKLAECLVPVAAVIYVFLALIFLVVQADRLPAAIENIVIGAFRPEAVTCGGISSFLMTLRVGTARGLFTNEAGMGTASIAHAGANCVHPVFQGLLGAMEVFIDTIVICTLTAFVILCSGIRIPYGTDPGINLTLEAFSAVYGSWCTYVITILTCIFAFATILGWSLYGLRCMQFLFGNSVSCVYIVFQCAAVLLGVFMKTSTIWEFAEIVNGLMAVPNLYAIVLLLPKFKSEIASYQERNLCNSK